MEERKHKYNFRPTATTAMTSGGRSQWHGMDLHSTATSTPNRRAMYAMMATQSPQNRSLPKQQPPQQPTGEDTSLSARNILIHRKLRERKLYDSADEAMKKVMMAMDHVPSASSATASPAPVAAETVNSPRQTVTPAHAKMGASVFVSALSADTAAANRNPVESKPRAMTPVAPSASGGRYGPLGASPSANAALSARSILIQKKLREKKHFDSADYQLARYHKEGGTDSQDSGSRSPTEDETDLSSAGSSPMDVDMDPTRLNSPAVSAGSSRNKYEFGQMSPSMTARPSTDRYAGLSAANEILRRKFAEKKRGDGDYRIEQPSDRFRSSQTPAQQSPRFFPQQQSAAPTSGYPNSPMASSSPVFQSHPPALQSPGTKYGKLCAANVLIRKKLKERKRFDSADYCMERAKQGERNENSDDMDLEASAIATEKARVESQAMNHPVAKHIKLSTEARPWASPKAAAYGSLQQRLPREGEMASHESRLMARNLVIQRRLAERKRFDSADFYAAKQA
ncbi:hypothetical protein Poli38472_009793 [Pythium oligandrum]|uniref:Uncharacterized protein n=1 Tax=Pythium oligandrum TaxID=41045 RepID=A0A8K1CGH5_PYTOL|nr:hypothetical protein Poli38472_009793 [Pythium oligandrum]|eukprot:TMW62300.1 hypothetical protein Poli38472_009793 [Pythium oligandrum]